MESQMSAAVRRKQDEIVNNLDEIKVRETKMIKNFVCQYFLMTR